MNVILLVENETLILDITRKFLESLGYEVFAVTTSGRALRLLAQRKGAVDLVILDLSLPIIAGQLLLPRIATEYPDLKIVICIADSEDKKKFANQPVVKGTLTKPFTFIELKEIVGNILNDNQRQGKAG